MHFFLLKIFGRKINLKFKSKNQILIRESFDCLYKFCKSVQAHLNCRFFLIEFLFFIKGLFYNDVCFMFAQTEKYNHEILQNKNQK